MTYYEIYRCNSIWVVWKWTDFGQKGARYKTFKTDNGVNNWAKKQWLRVIWR